MNVALTAIVKNENKYLREWVEYYKQLGVGHIYIGDNNDSDGEQLETVLYDYLELPNPYITIINIKNRIAYQSIFYLYVYNEYGYKYDWMCFFDLDEFLYLKEDKNLQEFLSRDTFIDAEQIHINWLIYDDNDLIQYDNRPVQERFTRISENLIINYYNNSSSPNYAFKSILRCNLDKKIEQESVHTFICKDTPLITVLENGNEIDQIYSSTTPDYYNACIKHYMYKTIEEYLAKKYNKISADTATNANNIDTFFITNKRTIEKDKFIKEYLNT